MNQFKITKKVLLLNVEEKAKTNLYSFVDLESNGVLTALGVKVDVELHKPVEVTLNVRITSEVFELKDGTRKFVNTSTMFVESFKGVK
ncbi:hypothetical protein [Priestia megaterium]|uniref:hypothetical protein n=1 Tax=Priestia megaterium TaxID=1404 RepID=UPI003D074C5D